MGRGSPICERVHTKIVDYFKNTVPQLQIAKALQISPSTVHNIIKRFRETGEISSGPQTTLIGIILSLTLLNGPRNTSIKPLLVNTIHRGICKCQLKLYHAKRKPFVNMVQKRCRVLWVKAHLKWTVSK